MMSIVLEKCALSNSSFGVNPEDISNHRVLVNPKIPKALAASMVVVRQLLGIWPVVVLSFWAALETDSVPDNFLSFPLISGEESLGTSMGVYNQGTKTKDFRYNVKLVWNVLP